MWLSVSIVFDFTDGRYTSFIPEILGLPLAPAGAAKHCDLVAVRHEALADLLDRRLESAVGGRHSASAHHGDPQVQSVGRAN